MTTVSFIVTYFNPYPYKMAKAVYNVNVISQVRNFWGTWVYPSCPNECWISGTWTAAFDYMSAATLGYVHSDLFARSYTYSHPNCINNFSASISPAAGITAPYPSSFIYTAPPSLAFLDLRLQNLHWNVSVPGGASGINCSVHCP